MTEFLGDWSNHDWGRGSMDFAAMRRDGVRGGTHKTSDGLNFYRDPYWPGAVGRMRSAFADGVYGSYHVLWGNRSIRAQVDWWFSILDATAAGWRADPRFAVMSDNEPFGYNVAPTIAQVNEAGDIIRALTGKTMLAYCPPWHYGAALGGLRYPLVSSNYGSNPIAHYLAAYPGDSSSRWGGAALLQYGSRTRMGAQSTCDTNAFRGSLEELRSIVGGPMASGILIAGEPLEQYIPRIERALLWQIPEIRDGVAALRDAMARVLTAQGAAQADVDALLARPAVTLAADQLADLGEQLAAVLAARPDNPLGEADVPTIQAALEQFFRTHFGQTHTPAQG